MLWLASGCGGGDGFTGDADADADVDADADSDSDTGGSAVCDRFRADYPNTAPWIWEPGEGACALGTVSPEAIADGVRRTNLFRAFAGLLPITEKATYTEKAQECAVLMQAMGTITHTPDPGAPCYTANAAEAAGSSNLFGGAGSLADSVDVYVGDEGVDSLGHRRWILFPDYAEGGFGIAGSFSCQWVFGFDDARVEPPYVPYPSEGDYPLEMIRGAWSVSAAAADWSGAVPTVTRALDGVDMEIGRVWVPPSGFGLDTLAWDVVGAGEGEYVVRVTGGSVGDLEWSVNVIACGG